MSRATTRVSDRLARLKAMADQVHTGTAELQAIQRNGTRPATIRIRDEFFYAKKGRQPSITRISAPRGVNTQIYLLLLFEAQFRRRTGIAGPTPIPIIPESDPEDASWDKIVISQAKDNSHGKSRTTAKQNKIRQIRSAFQRLHEENLAGFTPASAGRSATITALHEAGLLVRGSAYEYVVPNGSQGSVGVPATFFTRGWIYCLTPSEIHLYLALLHLERRNPTAHSETGVFCAGAGREHDYGMTRDVYESHLTLSRFGLIRKVPDPARSESGKIRDFATRQQRGIPLSAHRFKVMPPTALMGDAFPRVTKGLIWHLRDKERAESIAATHYSGG